MFTTRKTIRGSILIVVVATLAVACAPTPLRVAQGPQSIEIVPLGTYSATHSNFLLRLAGVKDIHVANRVDCYRIVYPSKDEHGQPIKLSGLLALPHDLTPTRLVSFQHGTQSNPERVPSNLSTDGLAAAFIFAGNGFAMVAPDYVGLGVSKLPQAYYVAADSARAVIDLVHSIRRIEGVPTTAPLFIGFSEGGYASLAAQRELEASGEQIAATATIAGAFDLRGIGLPWTLQGKSSQAPIYTALWVRGYATRYGHPLDSALNPPYVELVPKLFDTPQDPRNVMKALPRDPRDLLKPSVLDAVAGKGQHWLVNSLIENEMSNWTPKASVRMYYGAHDVDVPPEESIATARQMSARGANVQAIDVGPLDHNQSVLAAAPLILSWFRTIQ